MNPKHEEARLLRRIAHLRTILRYADDARIVGTVKELITETETEIVTLKPDHNCKAILQ